MNLGTDEKLNNKTVAIILAAGQGKRMGTDVSKQFLILEDKPLIYYSLSVFNQSPCIDEIILVTNPEGLPVCEEIVKENCFAKVSSIVLGGKERYHSVWSGLKTAFHDEGDDAKERKTPKYVLIHDGARPFVTEEIIQRNLDTLKTEAACVTAVPSKDTVKILDEEGYVKDTPNRSLVWNMQTPQSFVFETVFGAYQKLIKEEDELIRKGVQITDDAMVVEYFTDTRVKLVNGSYDNLKITTPDDLPVAIQYIQQKK